MHNIPTDNTLRRHCLTEIRNTQQANFDAMIYATQQKPEVIEHEYAPILSLQVILPLIGFIFVVGLLFI